MNALNRLKKLISDTIEYFSLNTLFNSIMNSKIHFYALVTVISFNLNLNAQLKNKIEIIENGSMQGFTDSVLISKSIELFKPDILLYSSDHDQIETHVKNFNKQGVMFLEIGKIDSYDREIANVLTHIESAKKSSHSNVLDSLALLFAKYGGIDPPSSDKSDPSCPL